MSNIAGSSTYSSANASTSTLRPRNNRLISYLEDAPSENDVRPQAASTSSSRGVSPATQARNRATGQPVERFTNESRGHTIDEPAGKRSSSIWGPWSSIQGVASSLLSGGEGSTSSTRKGSVKTPAWMKQDPRFKTEPAMKSWGPDGNELPAPESGSIDERKAMVQAKKREALLKRCAQEGRDELGNFKRKASYDGGARTASIDADMEKTALVYRHRVQPQDTLVGVTIKYSCQPEVFRKVNRFWPNDNIQTRAFVLVPVDACGIRGQKVDDATSLELLTKHLNKVELDSEQRPTSAGTREISSGTSSVVDSPKQSVTNEEDYQHESFVVLPTIPEPVEILRIPQKTLGYFPRPRRKSIQRQSESIASTPKTSFDMLRHPPTHAAQQAAAALSSSPYSQTSYSQSASPVHSRSGIMGRQRVSSVASNPNSKNSWFLNGPGGVGSLTGLRTEVSRPGPAEDSLNQKFAQYFPSLVIQSTPEDGTDHNNFPRTRVSPKSRSPYRATPRASTDSIRSSRSNSSTFGAGVAGVESFMRKLASGGKRPDQLPRTSSSNLINAMGLPIGGESGLGDLIELETNPDALHTELANKRGERFALGEDDDFEDNDMTPTDIGKSHEDLLNERFPVRGRVTRAYAGDEG